MNEEQLLVYYYATSKTRCTLYTAQGVFLKVLNLMNEIKHINIKEMHIVLYWKSHFIKLVFKYDLGHFTKCVKSRKYADGGQKKLQSF